jgi:LmbE family N-acetylglucosaminyl deacetylase
VARQEQILWTIEKSIRDEILRVEPHVVVTLPIHGISGFHDHIVTHFAVTRVYLELHGADYPWLQRLALFREDQKPPFEDLCEGLRTG